MELIERALDHLTMNVSANEAFRRPNGSMARVLTLIILLALPSLVDAHGRNSTSIRADVQEGGVRVVINAVVIDLLQLTGTSTADWEGLPLNEREGILRQGAGMMVARFRLVADKTLLPSVKGVEINLPDVESGPGRWLPVNQQSVSIALDYTLTSAPGELVFWVNFVAGPSGAALPAQILVRQDGELLLLPVGIGMGMPLALAFDWEREPEPLAEQTRLGSAVSGWQNRPPNSFLEFSGKEVTWRVFVPYRLLLRGLSLSPDTGLDELESLLSSCFSMSVDGQSPGKRSFRLQAHAMSAHGIAHGSEAYKDDLLDAMLEIRISCTLADHPMEVDLACSLIGDSLPVLYTSILPANGPPQFFTLTSQSPTLNWRPTP
jgi:hypothetical protein